MADNPTTCPFCNDTILIPEEFFGSEVECPTCHKQFFIPKIEIDETPSGGLDNQELSIFICPLCGTENKVPSDFTGKLKCQMCKNEIEVVNEDTQQCPHCGANISKNDTTCMSCQRAVNEPETKKQNSQNSPATPAENPSAEASFSEIFGKKFFFFDNNSDKEDAFVTTALQIFKIVNIVLFVITFFGCLIGIVFGAINKDLTLVVTLICARLGALYYTIMIHLVLCWFRGLYKNIMKIREAVEKKSGSQE